MKSLVAAAVLALGLTAGAQAATLDTALQPLSFLVGRWAGEGTVTDTGGRARGVSVITIEADGHALLRNDRNETVDKAGKPVNGFGQMMLIYDEAGAVKADYVDGEGHVIHYGAPSIVAGRSVEFTSTAQLGAPTFRLRYVLSGPDALEIAFAMAPPGQTGFVPIATGTVYRTH